jgi:TetR/AcrR family transcriptional regulator
MVNIYKEQMSMAESGRRRGETTREVILAAAETVFAEHGFDGARVEAIATVSGYDKKLIFHYFGDKPGLYAEVLKRTEQEAHALLSTVFANVAENESAAFQEQQWRHFLTTMVQALFDYLLDHPHFLRMLTWEMAEGWQTFTRIAARFPPEYMDQFERLFEIARSAGLLRSDFAPVILFTMLLQVCQVYLASLPLYQTLLQGEDLSSTSALRQARESLSAFVVAGIMGRPEN